MAVLASGLFSSQQIRHLIVDDHHLPFSMQVAPVPVAGSVTEDKLVEPVAVEKRPVASPAASNGPVLRKGTTATQRLKQDYLRILKDPVPYVTAHPLPSNILEW